MALCEYNRPPYKTIQANCKQMTQMKVKEAIQVCNLETNGHKKVDALPFVSYNH